MGPVPSGRSRREELLQAVSHFFSFSFFFTLSQIGGVAQFRCGFGLECEFKCSSHGNIGRNQIHTCQLSKAACLRTLMLHITRALLVCNGTASELDTDSIMGSLWIRSAPLPTCFLVFSHPRPGFHTSGSLLFWPRLCSHLMNAAL